MSEQEKYREAMETVVKILDRFLPLTVESIKRLADELVILKDSGDPYLAAAAKEVLERPVEVWGAHPDGKIDFGDWNGPPQ